MTTANQPSGFVLFLRGLLRLILVLLLGLLIGAGLYFAGMYVYQQAVLPSYNNSVELQRMKIQIDNKISQQQEDNTELENRINSLEITIGEQADLIDELNTALEENHTQFAALQDDQAAAIARLDTFDKALTELYKEQSNLSENAEKLTEIVNAEPEEDPLEALNPLQLEIKLLKTMQQINRARLFLFQDNYGLAKTEIELAQVFLAEMKPYAAADQEDTILLWEARLDLIATHLPDQPDLAEEDIEILWGLMAEGFTLDTAGDTETAEATPTPKP